MSRSQRHVYSQAVDGGGPGQVILRGPIIRDGQLLITIGIFVSAPVTFTSGCLLDFGWVSNPTAITSGFDPTGLPGPGSVYSGSVFYQFYFVHFGLEEVMVMTINNAPVTAGAWEILTEAVTL